MVGRSASGSGPATSVARLTANDSTNFKPDSPPSKKLVPPMQHVWQRPWKPNEARLVTKKTMENLMIYVGEIIVDVLKDVCFEECAISPGFYVLFKAKFDFSVS